MKNIIVFIILSFLFYNAFSQNIKVLNRSISPKNALQGDIIEIQIEMAKEDLQCFAEIKQIIPQGFSLIENQTDDYIVTMDNQIVKITWNRLPKNPNLVADYAIVAEKNAKTGEHIIAGEFVYIINNRRGVVMIPDIKFRLDKGVRDTQISVSTTNEKLNDVWCERQLTKDVDQNIIVNLTFITNNNQYKGQMREYLPSNYKFENMTNTDGRWILSENQIKANWDILPDKKEFSMSYKLIPTTQNLSGFPDIKGEFLYSKDGKLLEAPVTNKANNDNSKKNPYSNDFEENNNKDIKTDKNKIKEEFQEYYPNKR